MQGQRAAVEPEGRQWAYGQVFLVLRCQLDSESDWRVTCGLQVDTAISQALCAYLRQATVH